MSQYEIYLSGKGYVATVECSKAQAIKIAKQLVIDYKITAQVKGTCPYSLNKL